MNAIQTQADRAPVIRLRGLTKRFGPVTAVDGLDIDVHPGTVTGFLGANGAGKSTTLRMVLGLVTPTAGSATVFGRPFAELDDPARVGAVLETQSFNPLRRGRDHLRVIAAAIGADDARVDEVLDLVDLRGAAGRKAGTYSLGMRQRLGLAAALLGRPQALVLDEPANGLDPQGIWWLRGLLADFARDGGAVFVSSHQLAEIEQIADDVVVIHHGRLVRQAHVGELTAAAASVVVETAEAGRLADVLERAGLVVERHGTDELVVGAEGARVGQLALEAGIALSRLAPRQTTLERAFLEMTRQETTA